MIMEILMVSSKGLNALRRNTTCHATFVFHYALREQLVVNTLKRSHPMKQEFISFHSAGNEVQNISVRGRSKIHFGITRHSHPGGICNRCHEKYRKKQDDLTYP